MERRATSKSPSSRWPVAALAGAATLAVTLTFGVCRWGTPAPLVNRENVSTVFTDREDQLLRVTLTGDEKYRVWAPLTELSPSVVAATIAYEDRWFWWHRGFNPFAAVRAALQSVFGSRAIGGSTLTMQLARMRWRLQTRSLGGKLEQIAYAIWLEQNYSKQEILEAYLNQAPYGGNIEGVAAASWIYFRKPPSQLSIAEAQILSLIPQNPVKRSLDKEGAILEAKQAIAERLKEDFSAEVVAVRRADLPNAAPHFTERVAELSRRKGVIKTSLHLREHALVQDILTNFVRRNSQLGIYNATALVVDARTAEPVAYVGSANYTDPQILGFVNGLKARRSPGSALKPFIYGLGLDQGLITPSTLLKDTPLRIANYQPENFEKNYLGPISATEALVRSRNVPALTLSAQLRTPSLYEFFQQAHLSLPKDKDYYGLSLALGTFDVSMEELVQLYMMLARGGEYRALRWPRGEQIDPLEGTRLLTPEAAYLVLEMLRKNPRPWQAFGAQSFSRSMPVAWKTGTSYGARDAWAVGVVGSYVVGVWIGNFDGTPNANFVGRDAAGPLLFLITDALQSEGFIPPAVATPQLKIKKVEVCPLSGAPRGPHCPHGRMEWVIPGVSPIQPCSVHREILVEEATGLRLCSHEAGPGVRREVVEVWDSDVAELFRLAGMARQPVPAFKTACDGVGASDAGGRGPRIVSPQDGVVYQSRDADPTPVELHAISDGSRSELFWFVDNQLVGKGDPLVWYGTPGEYRIRVIDDQGQGVSRKLRIVPIP